MLDINEQIKGKVLLITGGTGSFGSTVLRHFFLNVDVNVSDKVVRIIQSYVGVVNKMVWRKF